MLDSLNVIVTSNKHGDSDDSDDTATDNTITTVYQREICNVIICKARSSSDGGVR